MVHPGTGKPHPNLDLVAEEFPSLTNLRLVNYENVICSDLMRSTTENLKMVGSERSVSAQPSFFHHFCLLGWTHSPSGSRAKLDMR